jgi:hypothetical protein
VAVAESNLFIDTDSVRAGAGEFTDVAAELAALPGMLSDACGTAADAAGYAVLSSALNGFASRFGAELQRQAEVNQTCGNGVSATASAYEQLDSWFADAATSIMDMIPGL